MLKFLKQGTVKNPQREFGNAGIDFFVPSFSSKTIDDIQKANIHPISILNKRICIPPHTDILIPTYFSVLMDANIALIAQNKSGIAKNKNLVIGASVVDASYEGIIHIHVINVSNNEQYIDFDQKLVQFVPFYINTEDIDIIENIDKSEFYKDHHFSRGSGGFGSTGLK